MSATAPAALRRLGARVVAIEPQPTSPRCCARQFAGDRRSPWWRPRSARRPGTATLFPSRRTPTVTTLSARWIERVQGTPGFARVAWQDRHEVAVTTLDALIARHGRPRFCKIDVEGFEAEVLRGLSQPLPALSLEYLPAAHRGRAGGDRAAAELGAYRCNVTLGERRRWLWPEWRAGGETAAWLARRRAGASARATSGPGWRAEMMRAGAAGSCAAAAGRKACASAALLLAAFAWLSLLWSLPAEPAALAPRALLVVAGEIVAAARAAGAGCRRSAGAGPGGVLRYGCRPRDRRWSCC